VDIVDIVDAKYKCRGERHLSASLRGSPLGGKNTASPLAASFRPETGYRSQEYKRYDIKEREDYLNILKSNQPLTYHQRYGFQKP